MGGSCWSIGIRKTIWRDVLGEKFVADDVFPSDKIESSIDSIPIPFR
jgi:hypothetical protein